MTEQKQAITAEKSDINNTTIKTTGSIKTIKKVYESMRKNQKSFHANTKEKGEVSGGGKKPWKQKGTGNARAGSNRSPLWRGGGITFGPKAGVRVNNKINKKEQKLALKIIIAIKQKAEQIHIKDIKILKPSTKEALNFLKNLNISSKVIIYTEKFIPEIESSFANISYVSVKKIDSINAVDLISSQNIIFTKAAWDTINQRIS